MTHKLKPKVAIWNLTNKCNLKCNFCFGPIKNKKFVQLSLERALKLLSKKPRIKLDNIQNIPKFLSLNIDKWWTFQFEGIYGETKINKEKFLI